MASLGGKNSSKENLMNMKKTIFQFLKSFFTEPQWEKVRGLFWFCFITVIFHILWRFWSGDMQYAPLSNSIYMLRTFLVTNVFNESVFLLNQVLHIHVTTEPHVIITASKFRITVAESTAGLKQICQFAILILLFPGSWKKKLWFIPLGIIIVHLTNVFRILCFVVIALHWPKQIHYAHDNYLRFIYYVVIFILWVIWVERIKNPKIKLTKKSKTVD
jgi:exosortase/archaeosortase family protein